MYLPKDHLGGTTKVLSASGAVLSSIKYWPYGALRSGGITQTEKLYTGQQQEPGDAALGLYNYKGAVLQHDAGAVLGSISLIICTAIGSLIQYVERKGAVPRSSGHHCSRWAWLRRANCTC